MGLGLREASVSETSDRGAKGVDRRRSGQDHAIDQHRIEVSEHHPLGTARGADERAEEIRMESLGTQSFPGSRSGTDDEMI